MKNIIITIIVGLCVMNFMQVTATLQCVQLEYDNCAAATPTTGICQITDESESCIENYMANCFTNALANNSVVDILGPMSTMCDAGAGMDFGVCLSNTQVRNDIRTCIQGYVGRMMGVFSASTLDFETLDNAMCGNVNLASVCFMSKVHHYCDVGMPALSEVILPRMATYFNDLNFTTCDFTMPLLTTSGKSVFRGSLYLTMLSIFVAMILYR